MNQMASATSLITQEIAQETELKLTDKATAQVKALLARENLEGYGLRVAVTSGGCSGFSYGLDFEKETKPGDVVLETDGLKIYMNESSAKHLKGTTIDYVSGLQGAGFKFINPNATSTCGCGTSFSA
ncbi:iron-sulfur cluster assembly accessory protein [bacterium]|nr:MAG: iron-sulfur cluster assembly accessory protein [bacterium]